MKKLRKFLLGCAICILTFVILLFAVPSVKVYAAGSYDENSKVVTIDVSGKRNFNGYAAPNGNYVQISISGSEKMSGVAAIYYTTQDRSAIASSGDYVAKNGVVYISKNNLSTTISIETHSTKFASTVKKGDNVTYEIRYYMFIITDVEYTDAAPGETCKVSNDQIKCSLSAQKNLEAIENKQTNANFSYYSAYDTFQTNEINTEVEVDWVKLCATAFYNSTTSYYLSNYVNTGLADFYAGMELSRIYNSKLRSCADFWVTLRNSNRYDGREPTDQGDNLVQYRLEYSRYNNSCIPFSDVIHDSDKKLDNLYNSVQYNDNKGAHEDRVRVTDYTKAQYMVDASGKEYRMSRMTDVASKENPDYSMNDVTVRAYIDNSYTWAIYDVELRVTEYLTIQDYKKPEAIAAYIDGTTTYATPVSQGDDAQKYVRVAIRYDEPVQLYNSNKATYALFSIGSSSDNYRFEYEGGAGTDTLYFRLPAESIRASLNSEVNLATFKGFVDDSGETLENICDLAIHHRTSGNNVPNFAIKDKIGGYSNYQIKNCHIDLAKHTVEPSTANPELPVANRTVNFTAELSHGNLYYAWVRKEDFDSFEQIKGNTSSYQGVRRINNDIGKQTVSISGEDKDGNLLNGEYYLYVLLDSFNGKKSIQCFRTNASGAGYLCYTFDSTAPTVSCLTMISDADNIVKKEWIATVLDTYTYNNATYTGVGVDSIYMTYDYIKGDATSASGTIELWNGDNISAIEDERGAKSYNPETGDLSFSLVPKEFELDASKGEYGYYQLTLHVVDKCNNEHVEKLYGEYRFDTRTLFKVSAVEDTNNSQITIGDQLLVKKDDFSAYLLDNGSVSNVIQLTFTNLETTGTNFNIRKLTYQNKLLIDNGVKAAGITDDILNEYVSISPILSSTTDITIIPKKAGKLSVSLSLDGTKTSNTYTYYFTKTLEDDTLNYGEIQNTHIVKSKVYQLGNPTYYYIGSNWKDSVQTKNYNDNSLNLCFSNKEEAIKYVQYYEYQDFYLLQINESQANYLSGGGNVRYTMAEDETTTPAAGQYWIRYKRKDFKLSNTTNDWVYYYYAGDGSLGINVSKISTNLANAVYSVVNYIVDQGEYTYLIDEEYQTPTGAIMIDPQRIITEDKQASSSFSGSTFTSPVSYLADSAIYSDYYIDYKYQNDEIQIIKENKNLHYLMYYVLRQSTAKDVKFFILDDSSSFVNATEILDFDENTLDSYIKSGVTGVYTFVEMDENGIRKFQLYVDHLEPSLHVEYVSSIDESLNERDLDSSDSLLSVKQITFDRILATEADLYSYVSIYIKRSFGNKHVKTLLLSELLSDSFSLEDNAYLLVVSDRYGNRYEIDLNLKGEVMKCTSTIPEDGSFLRIRILNRTEDEILSYSVKGPSTTVTQYTADLKVFESGYYFIEIKDIYGNVYRGEDLDPEGKGILYQRTVPQITWKYLSDGSYIPYRIDEKTGEPLEGQPMEITKQSETNYYIVTSRELEFSYSDDYTYSFIDGNPERGESQLNGTKVKIKELTGWTVKIWYNEYPDVYVIYACQSDIVAPSISAEYEISDYVIKDEEELSKIAGEFVLGKDMFYDDANVLREYVRGDDGEILLDDNKNPVSRFVTFEGTSAYFKPSTEDPSPVFLKSGDVCQSDKISLTVSDENGVKSVVVYLNGEVLKDVITFDAKKNAYVATLKEVGKYTIVAEDYFGNTTNFTFTNAENTNQKHSVDGKVTTKNNSYGNTSDEIVINSKGVLRYYITTSTVNGPVSHQYSFNIGELGIYQVGNGYQKTEIETISGKESYLDWTSVQLGMVYIANDSAYNDGTWYLVEGIEDTIYIMHDNDGYHFRVDSNMDRKKIEVGYLSSNSAPFEYETYLSQEVTNVILRDINDEKIETNTDGEVILIHNVFHIDDSNGLDDIEKIRVSFSKTTTFVNFTTIYYGVGLNTFDATRDGFYQIEITNIFGNVLVYTLSKSNSMTVVVDVTYKDGTANSYGTEYTATTYSNNSVKVTLFSTEGEFSITRNSEVFTGYETVVTKNSMSVEITLEGSYSVLVYDEYGNTKVRRFIIQNDSISFDEGLIFGYNEEALRYDEGYTNGKLSIDYKKLLELDICYVSVARDNEDPSVIYDIISEKKVYADADLLLNSICTDGTGVYTVVFRDKFGNSTNKVIHYAEESTLTVSYNYRSSTQWRNATDLSEGVWSNNSVLLATTSKKYEYKVNGEKSEISDTPFSFSSSDGNGQFVYHIEYIDEYGFTHEFDITLLRQSVTVELAEGIEVQEVSGRLTTKSDFSVIFTNGATITYKMDDIYGPYDYEVGEVLIEEGVYVFTAVDRAGNTGTLTIEKDTSVDFQFVETSLGKTIISGYVASSKVQFESGNKDGATIYKIYRNGVEYKDTNEFTETGKYEILVRDAAENEGFFMFYIITHSLSNLEYSVPENYVITELWRTDSMGYTNTYLDNESVKVDEYFKISEDGKYSVVMENIYTGTSLSFKFEIDSTPPTAKLSGCEEGETTVNTVTLSGLSVGDVVYVYKNGKLVKTVDITSVADAPSISEGGVYKIVVVNEAGVSTTLNFTRVGILNKAGSALIIISLSTVVIALFAGLVFRKRSKIDK